VSQSFTQPEPTASRHIPMRIESRDPGFDAAVPVAPRARAYREQPSAHLHAAQARALLGAAWSSVLGSLPSARAVAILTAHWALETDAGRAMPGHNFAGIKAAPNARGVALPTPEGHGAARREVTARFRVYDNAEAGAVGYVRLLATRYPAAVVAANAGDAAGFSQALAHGGYCTADPQAYAVGIEQRLRELEHGSPLPASAAPGALAQAALGGLLHALAPRDDT
jgi:hypothetical protein